MSAASLLLVWLWPLLAAALVLALALRGARRSVLERWLPAAGAVPAMLLVGGVPVDTQLELPWLLLGGSLLFDTTARVYLAFSAALWFSAGLYAADYGRRFAGFFLVSMGGNFWLILARDLPGFYTGFALMGLAAYGLIIHDGRFNARRAGVVYLILTLLGEVTLFAALAVIASESGTLRPEAAHLAGVSDLAIALTVLGFGVKAALVPLHWWLPPSYVTAPPPAAAVLSGAMIKAALIGWLRFLPLGAHHPGWGFTLGVLGSFMIVFALTVGLRQTQPKAILAYSSIAKMGLVVLTLGALLQTPALVPAGIAALTLFAAHHALVKGGLFLGVGLRADAAPAWQPLVLVALLVLTLALADAPLTSGAATKQALKPLLDVWPGPALSVVLLGATVATVVLMARFYQLCWRWPAPPVPRLSTAPLLLWIILVGTVLWFPFLWTPPAAWWNNAVPFGIGLVLSGGILWLWPVATVSPRPWFGRALPRGPRWLSNARPKVMRPISLSWTAAADSTIERLLRHWPLAGGLWLALLLALAVG